MRIRFFYEDVDFKLKQSRKNIEWLIKSAELEKKSIAEIRYIFCSDKFLLEINKQFLKHKTLTDIITFNLSEGSSISGEIYISIDRVLENTTKFNATFEGELHRVMIHGMLHLFGYNDKHQTDIDIMRKKEEAYLSLWNKMFHVKH